MICQFSLLKNIFLPTNVGNLNRFSLAFLAIILEKYYLEHKNSKGRGNRIKMIYHNF